MTTMPNPTAGTYRWRAKTMLLFCAWSILIGPVVQVLMWATVEGPPLSYVHLLHSYIGCLVHFLLYTALFGGVLMLPRTSVRQIAWPGVLGGVVALASVASLTAVTVLDRLSDAGRPTLGQWIFSTLTGIGITSVVLLMERLYFTALSSRLEAQGRALDQERAKRSAAEARWLSLESRVHPHFLFNTLGSIRELMHRDIAQADQMIQRFASLIRFSLDSGNKVLVPVAEELWIVEQYLEIEKMRLGPRLSYRIQQSHGVASAKLPALSVLTLVENSIKHAIASRRSGGRLEIDASYEGENLRVDVLDDGPGFDCSQIVADHGLDLLLGRLESCYKGQRARLVLPQPGDAVRVTLLIPVGAAPHSIFKYSTF